MDVFLFIKKEGKKDPTKNILLPILAILASLFMVVAAIYAHGIRPYLVATERGQFAFPVLFYLIVFAVIMGLGGIWYKNKDNRL